MRPLIIAVLVASIATISGSAVAKDYRASAYCPMKHVTGYGRGPSVDVAKAEAIKACLAKGGVPACCNKFVRML
jgi:hypothetical protein